MPAVTRTGQCLPLRSGSPSSGRLRITGLCTDRGVRPVLAWVVIAVICSPVVGGGGLAIADSPRSMRNNAYCGLNCLYAALRILDTKVSYPQLIRPEYIHSAQGSTLADLVNAAERWGVRAMAIRNLTVEDLPGISDPMILHVKSSVGSPKYNHFVLLVRLGHRFVIMDPPDEPKEVSFRDLRQRWAGTAVLVSPGPIAIRRKLFLTRGLLFLVACGLVSQVCCCYGILNGEERRLRSGGQPPAECGFRGRKHAFLSRAGPSPPSMPTPLGLSGFSRTRPLSRLSRRRICRISYRGCGWEP
jgi:hypothetical protein